MPRLQAALALALAEARLARVRREEVAALAARTPVAVARQRLLLRYRREAEAGHRRALRAWIALERRTGSTAPTPPFPETNPIPHMR